MRACSCGEWVPESKPTCPKCGNEMAAASRPSDTWAPPPTGSGVAAAPPKPSWAPDVPPGWDPYQGKFVAEPAPAPPPPLPPYAPPTGPAAYPPPANPAPGYGYAPPAAPKKKGAGFWIGISALIIVVLLIGAVGLVAVFGNSKSPLDGYVHGKGQTFSFRGDTASVRLPDTPEIESNAQKTALGNVNTSMAIISKDEYEVAFMEITFQHKPPNVKAALRNGLKSGMDAMNVKVSKYIDSTLKGYPAVSAEGTAGSDHAAGVIFYANGKVYAFLTHTPDRSPQVLTAMEQSFQAK